MKRHHGCLVLLLPFTTLTLCALGYVVWMIVYCIIIEGEELFPPTANIGLMFLIFALVCNIPTAVLWWAYFILKRDDERQGSNGTCP